MATIGKKVIASVADTVRLLLMENQKELDKAYLKAEGAISLAVTVKIKPSTLVEGSLDIDTGVSFVLEKVKATMGHTINEHQEALFSPKREEEAENEGQEE